jgi:hypothetical protein
MTIHQLPEPCFVLDPNPWRYSQPHYGTRAEAEAALAKEREETDSDDESELNRLAATRTRQLSAPCWIAECDAPEGPEGTCGDTLGDEDEGPSCIHFGTVEELFAWMPGEGWIRVFADNALCWSHSPENPAPPSPSPAEQEAAGHLVIPGILP